MLQDELRAVFLPRFLTAARARLERARAGDHSQAAAELHALAGESMLLGLSELSGLAVEGEAAARRCFEASDEAARVRCAELLGEIVERLESVASASRNAVS
jgi:HPt (histidine-containing phosphotransfer) domain-containing protein